MAISLKKRDLILIAIGVAILVFLWQAPPESTKRVPQDETHRRFHEIAKADGKKAAEKFCEECHKDGGVPFPPGHPPKSRCLFCHKLASN